MTLGPNGSRPADKAVCFAEILKAEMEAILSIKEFPERKPSNPTDGATDEEKERAYENQLHDRIEEVEPDLSALCLSGGGIRSATFALGVIQGLASFGLLNRFHYLSSVSGGGYIASWLSTWRTLARDCEVLPALNQALQTGVEAAQITGIRKDSNYLTPTLGLLSADTWTVITLYVRNLLLNWALFVPFFMGCLMLPHVCVALLTSANSLASPDRVYGASRLLGGLSVLIGLTFGIYGRFRRADKWLTDSRFLWLVVAPLMLSGGLFTVGAVVVGESPEATFAKNFASEHLPLGFALGVGIYLIAWVVGRLMSFTYTASGEKAIETIDVAFWSISGGVVGLLVAMGMNRIAEGVVTNADRAIPAAEALGLSGFVLSYLLGELLYVGLASRSRKGDMDREWLARSSGWLSAATVAWAVVSGIALYAPTLLELATNKTSAVIAAAGGVSGVLTLVLGSSGLTAATKAAQTLKSVPLMRIASAAAVIFAVLIVSLLAFFDQQLERMLAGTCPCSATVLFLDVILFVVLIVAAFALSRLINVNRFSMHAIYRNRLVRAFPGSARAAARKPDPFTGFDPADNPPLAKVVPLDAAGRLFHVINSALNVVSSNNPAWQERKAESFTMSRLHCGNPYVGYRRTQCYGGRRTGGLTLGTAMAISGAAVSPNQGYNSSPLIGFLLMLFNVRLGWWLGSPSGPGYFRSGPKYSLTPALRELFGDTSDKSHWIYLSDGGHFENLGLYEMIRRRCRMIVISDAGCDPESTYEDLGNAVRKVFIDFGVSIDFEKLDIKARQNPPVPGLRFAIGSIRYPGSANPGWLLYIKPTYQGTERADIRSYASGSRDFPHESTTDQWFSESQLESYRALGANVAEYICKGAGSLAVKPTSAGMTLDDLKTNAETLMAP
jgi:hypothetical protein